MRWARFIPPFFWSAVACLPATAANSANSGRPPVRLAVAVFQRGDGGERLEQVGRSLADLLTVELSRLDGIEIVEREEVARAVDELILAQEATRTQTEVLRIGRFLKADSVICGTLIGEEETVTAVARLTDVDTGVLRDFVAVPLERDDPMVTATRLSSLLAESSRATGSAAPERLFVGIGGFENLNIGTADAGVGAEIRAALQARLADDVCLVERSLVKPLLDEFELRRGGMLAGEDDKARAAASSLLVDGLYQSTGGETPGIAVTLRMREIGGREHLASVSGRRGEQLNTRLAAAIEDVLELVREQDDDGAGATVDERRAEEAHVLYEKGLELFGGGAETVDWEAFPFVFRAAGAQDAGTDEKHRRNVEEAIRAFEASLLLRPSHPRTRMALAVCLCNEAIGHLEKGRDLFREVMATSNSEQLRLSAHFQLAASYGTSRTTFELFASLLPKIRSWSDRAHVLDRLRRIETGLRERGETPASVDPEKRAWLADLYEASDVLKAHKKELELQTQAIFQRAAYAMSSSSGNVDAYSLVMQNYANTRRILGGNEKAAQLYFQSVMSMVEERFGKLQALFEVGYALGNKATPELQRRLHDAIAQAVANPESVGKPETFAQLCFQAARRLQFGNDVKGVLLACEFARRHEKRMPPTHWFDLCKYYAWAHKERGEWQRALSYLEQVDGDSTLIWNNTSDDAGIPVQRAIEECRAQLGMETFEPPDPVPFDIGSPLVSVRDVVHLASHKGQLWLATSKDIFRYADESWQPVVTAAASPVEGNILSLAAAGDRLYVGTALNGLYILDKRGKLVAHLTEEDGLPLPSVVVVRPANRRLWMGFVVWDGGREPLPEEIVHLKTPLAGRREGAGAVLNLETRSVDRFSGDPAAVASTRATGTRRNKLVAPPGKHVVDIAWTDDPCAWLAVRAEGLKRYDGETRQWATATGNHDLDENRGDALSDSSMDLTAIAANAAYVVVGSDNSGSHGAYDPRRGGLSIYDRRKDEWTAVSRARKLPNPRIYDLALAGSNRLVVGGHFYLAILDLGTKRVTHTCSRFDQRVLQTEVCGGDLWVVTDGPLSNEYPLIGHRTSLPRWPQRAFYVYRVKDVATE